METNQEFLSPAEIERSFGLKAGMNVADFGSGSGDFSIATAKKVGSEGHVTAIDIRQVALEALHEKAKSSGIDNLSIVHADLEANKSSGLGDASQDLVLLINILFQSKNKKAILSEAARVLMPKGNLIIIDWKKGTKGFGPPEDMRMDDSMIRQLIEDTNLSIANELDTGSFHFGYTCKRKS